MPPYAHADAVQQVLSRYDLSAVRPDSIVMAAHEKLPDQTTNTDNHRFKATYDALLTLLDHLASKHRPDIRFATHMVQRMNPNPAQDKMKAVLRIYAYLRSTPSPVLAVTYADADDPLDVAYHKLYGTGGPLEHFPITTVNPHRLYKEDLSEVRGSPGGDCVRLIRLSAKTWTGVDCEIKVFSLKLAPPYTALSYSWGDNTNTTYLRIGKEKRLLPVSENLAHALQSLCAQKDVEWFWVDAICINQSHPSERRHQVGLMQAIYKNAQNVFIWLGREPRAAGSLKTTLEDGHEPTESGLTYQKMVELLAQGEKVWWSRVWVIQECVAATYLHVRIGDRSSSWERFVQDAQQVTDRMLKGKHSTSAEKAQPLITAAAHIVQLRDLRKHLRSSPGGEEILDLLRRTPNSYATDLRDKVYALLGLATERDQAGVVVDYEKSAAEAYKRLVIHVIRSKSSVDLLVDQWPGGQTLLPHESYAAEHLPSWTPNFSQGPRTPPPLFHQHNYWAASYIPPSIVYTEKRAKCLKIDGIMFDEIEETSLDCIEDASAGEELDYLRLIVLPVLDNTVLPALEKGVANDSPLSWLDRRESYWRTLVADHGWDKARPAPSEFGQVFDILRKSALEDAGTVFKRLTPFKAEVDQFILRVLNTLTGRAIFSTRLGFVGVGPKDTKRGDKIAVPFGASMPFVLTKDPKFNTYSLVGECYVHGIMYGELVRLYKEGSIKTNSFVLT